jgi:hypothetical protein
MTTGTGGVGAGTGRVSTIRMAWQGVTGGLGHVHFEAWPKTAASAGAACTNYCLQRGKVLCALRGDWPAGQQCVDKRPGRALGDLRCWEVFWGEGQ